MAAVSIVYSSQYVRICDLHPKHKGKSSVAPEFDWLSLTTEKKLDQMRKLLPCSVVSVLQTGSMPGLRW